MICMYTNHVADMMESSEGGIRVTYLERLIKMRTIRSEIQMKIALVSELDEERDEITVRIRRINRLIREMHNELNMIEITEAR